MYGLLEDLWQERRFLESAALLSGIHRRGTQPAVALANVLQLLHASDGFLTETQRESAVRIIDDAVDASGENAHVLLAAAMLMIDLDDMRASAAYAVRIEPLMHQFGESADRAALAHVLGRIAVAAGNLEVAAMQLEHAVSLDPETPEHATACAEILLALARANDAAEVVATALRRHPSDPRLIALSRRLM